MNKYLLYILVCGTVLFGLNRKSIGQDLHFTQFYATPIFMNPAFTGTTEHSRAATTLRRQWPGVGANYLSSTLSYDRNAGKFNSSWGMLISMDRAGTGNLRNTEIGGLYAYDIRSKNNTWHVKTGLNFSYGYTAVNFEKLTFGDQLSVNGVVYDVTQDTGPMKRNSYFDVSTGGLFYTKGFWLGVSAKHLNTPNQGLIGINSQIPYLISVHGGGKFNLVGDYHNKHEIFLIPSFQYKAQGAYDQFDLATNLQYEDFSFGLSYRGLPGIKHYAPGFPNNDAMALLLGYRYAEFWRFGYSYDITISNLASNSSGAHELSVIYEFSYEVHRKKPKRSEIKVKCPFPMQ